MKAYLIRHLWGGLTTHDFTWLPDSLWREENSQRLGTRRGYKLAYHVRIVMSKIPLIEQEPGSSETFGVSDRRDP